MARRLLFVYLFATLAVPAAAEEVTGLIVDATLLDLQRCRFPKLYDPDGVMIYPTRQLCQNADYRQGFTGYAPTLNAARRHKRAGANPLVLRPERLNEQDPTRGSVDLTAEQTKQLLALDAESGVLNGDRVVIVIGLAVIETTPADGATMAPDTPLRVVFSKQLRDGEPEKPGQVSLMDADGRPVPVEIHHRALERTVEIKPTAPLERGRGYRLTLSGKLTAISMATLVDDVQVAFTIESQPPPSDPAAPADKEDGATD